MLQQQFERGSYGLQESNGEILIWELIHLPHTGGFPSLPLRWLRFVACASCASTVTYRSEKHWTGAKKELRGNKAKRKYTQQYFKERSQSLSSCRRLVWAAWRLYQTIVFPMAHLSSEVIKALAGMALWKLRKWKLYLFTLDSMITYETDWSNLKPQLEKREWNQN